MAAHGSIYRLYIGLSSFLGGEAVLSLLPNVYIVYCPAGATVCGDQFTRQSRPTTQFLAWSHYYSDSNYIKLH